MIETRYFLLLLLLLMYITAEAQIVNIEKHKLEQEDTANIFLGNVDLSFSLFNRGAAADNPVNLVGLNASVNLAYLSKNVRYLFVNQNNFLSINDAPFLNTGFSHLRVNFFRGNPINFEGFTQWQYDNFRGLDSRAVVGTGIRFRVADKEKTTLVLGTGGMFESEQWQHPVQEEGLEIRNLIKSSTYILIRRQPLDFVNYNMIVFYQVGYDKDPGVVRHRINIDTNLNIDLTKKLALVINFNGGFENRPIVPITKFIYSLTNGLKYNF